MSKNSKVQAAEILKKINTDLIETPRAVPLTKEEIIRIIKQHIDHSYAELSVEDRKYFYRDLSLLLHPDKNFSGFSKLYTLLEQFKISDMPFQYLNEINSQYQEVNLLEDVAKPSGLSRLLDYISSKTNPMYESFNRYYEPFQFLAQAVYWILFAGVVGIGILGVITLIASVIAISLTYFVINGVTNFITDNQYDKELHGYLESNFEKCQKTFTKKIMEETVKAFLEQGKKEEVDQIKKMDTNAFYEFILTELFQTELKSKPALNPSETKALYEEVKGKLHQKVLDSVELDSYTRVRFLVASLYKSITKPLDEVEGNKYLSILIRPLQAIALPFIVGVAVVTELVNNAIVGATYAAIISVSLVSIAVLALLNTPLYALDLSIYLVDQIQKCVSGQENSHDVDLDNKGPKTLLMLEWHKENSAKPTNNDMPPVHGNPLFAKHELETVPEKIQDLDSGITLSC